jgi:hypothetical protein
MDDTSATVLATLGAATALGAALIPLVLRRRKGARARFYFSVRTDERTDTKVSNEPPPFPLKKDDDNG